MQDTDQRFKKALSLHQSGDVHRAEEIYRSILNEDPDHIDSLVNISALVYSRDPQAAAGFLQKVIRLRPDSANAHFNLGNILQRDGQFKKAIARFREVIRIEPDYHQAYFRLGICYSTTGQLNDAIYCYRKAFQIHPKDASILNNLIEVLNRTGDYDEAERVAHKALELHPDLAEAHANLGNTYQKQGLYRKAEHHYREAIKQKPDDAQMLNNLGAVLLHSHRPKEATQYLKKAIDIDPEFHLAYSSYIYALNYFEEMSREEIYEAHCEWDHRFGRDITDASWPHIDPDPDRKLRVGFFSPDFRGHVVALFIQSLFDHYDRDRFEFYGYAQVSHPDRFTYKLQSRLDGWRTTVGMNDEALCKTVKDDRIDILVDLAGHTSGNRLPVFTYKPAPVQVSYLGYINTTGLRAFDYRFTDRWVNPPETQDFYTEELYCLPDSFTCYTPIEPCPDPAESPCLDNGFVTFGCFNNTNKLTDEVIELWTRIILETPGSKLMLKSTNLSDKDTRERLLEKFGKYGLDKDRLVLEGPDVIYRYMERFAAIDIALDPFPHNGGTTTHDALWMGVPVISLEGDRYVSRFGVTILNNLGHPEWLAADKEEYVEIAKHLADNPSHLDEIRGNLRQQMKTSPL